GGQQDVVHVGIVSAVFGDDRAAELSSPLEVLERLVICLPDRDSLRRDRARLLELGSEEGRADVADEVRGTEVDPGVLVDLTAEELAAVGPFLLDDLGPLDPVRPIDQEGAAFAARHVLCLVEAEAGAVGASPERAASIRSAISLRRIFDQEK